MTGSESPRRVHRGVRSALWASGYDMAFALLGTGFALTEAGRLFVPLIGKPRHVPAPQEEMRWATAWPKLWHAVAAFLVCMVIGGASVNGATLQGSLTGVLLFPGSFLAILLIWIWRERVVIASWPRVEGVRPDRTALVVSALSEWSSFRLITHFSGQVAFAVLVLRPWKLLRWPLVPPIDQIGAGAWLQRWAAAVLMLLLVLVLARAIYWAARALQNKWSLARGAA